MQGSPSAPKHFHKGIGHEGLGELVHSDTAQWNESPCSNKLLQNTGVGPVVVNGRAWKNAGQNLQQVKQNDQKCYINPDRSGCS